MAVGDHKSTDAILPLAGDPVHWNPHDTSSRQVVFRELTPNHLPLMTERDLFTGMRRYVRRSGPLPPPENDLCHRRNALGEEYHLKDNSLNTGTFCGLCDSTQGPFIQTECCGNWVCDTEHQYVPMSYNRFGQCSRNHRLGSICGFHHQEEHGSDWKVCQECKEYFHPFDYAVKASSQANGGSVRRYNFDNNCRHDLDLTELEFPTCDECKAPVDTTEESTRTISMRHISGGGKVYCKHCGGGFGQVRGPLMGFN